MRSALRRPRVLHVPLALALGTLVASRAAHAQQSPDIARGRTQFEAAAIADAEATFRAVAAAPTATRAELAAAHRYLAALALARGHDDDARRAAAIALALEPGAPVPPGAPPGLAAVFERARGPSGEGGMSVALAMPRAVRAGEAPDPVRVATRGVPEGLGARLRVRCAAGSRELGALEADAPVGDATLAVPVAAPDAAAPGALACEASVATPQGAVIARAAARQPVAPRVSVVLAPAPRRPAAPRRGAPSAAPWVVGITAAVLLVGGAVALGVVLGDGAAHLGAPQPVQR